MTRDELLVTVSARILALPDDAPRAVAVDGMSCVGKTTLAAELATVVSGAGRPVVPVSYDDFHHPADVRHRQERLSAQGYLDDSYDPAALRRLVLDPLIRGDSVVTASFDIAADEPVDGEAVPLPPSSVVMVEGEFLLSPPGLRSRWDLGILLIAEPAAVMERALVRDADLGSPEQIRELYVRRYLGAWALYEERDDPWRHADVVVDLTDPAAPRILG